MKVKKGKSLCFFSAKGGVGKTTNLINLAGIFEQLEKRVLLIDMDLTGGSIAHFLNKTYDRSISHVVEDLFYHRFTELEDYVTKYDDYIDLLCAPKDPREGNLFDHLAISDIIHKAEYAYDVVLIDMNHSLNDVNLAVLDTVREIFFVTTNDPLDLKNMKNLVGLFEELEIKKFKIILNNSRDPFKDYFSLYDIKHILKHNIDYTLSSEMFLKDMEKYIMKGIVLSLDRKFATIMSKDYQTFLVIATDVLEEDKDE